MKTTFGVTFEIITPESAEDGEADSRGWIEEGASLRDALKALHGTRTNRVGGVEDISLDSWPCERPRSITVTNGSEFETGAHESRALHIPASVTRSSARRIARAAGAKLFKVKA